MVERASLHVATRSPRRTCWRSACASASWSGSSSPPGSPWGRTLTLFTCSKRERSWLAWSTPRLAHARRASPRPHPASRTPGTGTDSGASPRASPSAVHSKALVSLAEVREEVIAIVELAGEGHRLRQVNWSAAVWPGSYAGTAAAAARESSSIRSRTGGPAAWARTGETSRGGTLARNLRALYGQVAEVEPSPARVEEPGRVGAEV